MLEKYQQFPIIYKEPLSDEIKVLPPIIDMDIVKQQEQATSMGDNIQVMVDQEEFTIEKMEYIMMQLGIIPKEQDFN